MGRAAVAPRSEDARRAAAADRAAAPRTERAAPARRHPSPRRAPAPRRRPVRRASGHPRQAAGTATLPRGARILDALLTGRAWIALVGVLLAGIVFFNVDLLQMNREITQMADRAAQIKRQNDRLRHDYARLASSERIQEAAAALGLVLPAPGEVRYLTSKPMLDARKASKRIVAPNPTYVAPEPITTAPDPATGTTTTTVPPVTTPPASTPPVTTPPPTTTTPAPSTTVPPG
jgi:cell division protein FtsL